MRFPIERQLQTAVNNIVKWCDTNGHSISASKSCCVHFLPQTSKSTVAPVVFQRVRLPPQSVVVIRPSTLMVRNADYVGCGVVIEDIMHGYRLDTCSIFTVPKLSPFTVQFGHLIDSTMPRKYCIYTDSMSVLKRFENYNDRCHPVVCKILDITSRLYSKGFDIVFCWLPSHVGIIGNEQADSAVKRRRPICR
ncbi:pggt1b [Trichonephila clavipes]|nr:pggt1b [Trichonephila clavipes]